MNKIQILILLFLFNSCKAQTLLNSNLKFTSDLRDFKDLTALRESLKDVEIIALGEQSHGLGEVFNAKTELVKFLHKELGFDLVLFESGYGDGALARERLDSLSPIAFTNSFSSNHYYNSEEILTLVTYVKSHKQNLKIKGFDCQPQQNFLIKRMTEIAQPLDSVLGHERLTLQEVVFRQGKVRGKLRHRGGGEEQERKEDGQGSSMRGRGLRSQGNR